MDLTWYTDAKEITRSNVRELGSNAIGRPDILAPCKDFALSRLLPSKFGGKLKNPRPGLQGKHGKILLCCLQVLAWVHEFNPKCELFAENLQFEDLVADRKIACLPLHGKLTWGVWVHVT